MFFLSDNTAPVHPAIMQAIVESNKGYALSYGADDVSEKARTLMREKLGTDADIYWVNTGTSANVLCLQTACLPHQAILCSEVSHLHTDECGAVERYLGAKLLLLPHCSGKVQLHELSRFDYLLDFEHHVQPAVLSVSQATEYGTVYTTAELAALSAFCKTRSWAFHIDGARLANALISEKITLSQWVNAVKPDILSLGGTKNGMLNGEAVVIFNKALGQYFPYQRKQAMQLSAKTRFIAAQWLAYFKNDLWLDLAANSNAMAKMLSDGLSQIAGIEVVHPVQANAVFIKMEPDLAEVLLTKAYFYPWDLGKNEYRLMCSWNTNAEEIDSFINEAKQIA